MGKDEMRRIAEAHSFGTEEVGGRLFVLVPWSQRLGDGTLVSGVDRELVGGARDLANVLGY